MWWQAVVEGLKLAVHRNCLLCQRSATQVFCFDCERQLQGRHGGESKAGFLPGEPQDSVAVWAWGEYEGSLKRAITLLKYQRCAEIARPLGEGLARSWLQQRPRLPRCQVVPIPLHCDRKRQRGYNQAELIAHHFCRITGDPLWAAGLVRQKPTAAQHQLSRRARYQNLADAFCIGPRLKTQAAVAVPVLLLDDIYTSGATAKSAAATLTVAGFTVCGVLSVARAVSG